MIFLCVLAHNSINQGLNIHAMITAHTECCLSPAGCYHDFSINPSEVFVLHRFSGVIFTGRPVDGSKFPGCLIKATEFSRGVNS